ncbi:hypothetical protein EV2_035758 [Malus domestica]
MSSPSDRRFDLNLVEEAATPSPDNIWRSSFLSPTVSLTVGDSVMKNDMTAAVVARNLLTPKDNRLLSKRSDELAVKDSLALSVQCAGSVSNMAQRLFARTLQVESLAAEVISLKQEIRGLKHENKQLHRLAHDYATNMKMKLDQLQESDGQILLDHQKFVSLFQRHLLPSSSEAVPRNEAPNDQPSVPHPSGVLPSTEAPNNHPLVPLRSGALPTAEASPTFVNAPSCLFILIHVYVLICNLSEISINKICFISTYCVKYTKAFFTKFFEFFLLLKLVC